MTAGSWLDRLEAKCGPLLPWCLAVGMVVTLLPLALLWQALAAKRQSTEALARQLESETWQGRLRHRLAQQSWAAASERQAILSA